MSRSVRSDRHPIFSNPHTPTATCTPAVLSFYLPYVRTREQRPEQPNRRLGHIRLRGPPREEAPGQLHQLMGQPRPSSRRGGGGGTEGREEGGGDDAVAVEPDFYGRGVDGGWGMGGVRVSMSKSKEGGRIARGRGRSHSSRLTTTPALCLPSLTPLPCPHSLGVREEVRPGPARQEPEHRLDEVRGEEGVGGGGGDGALLLFFFFRV